MSHFVGIKRKEDEASSSARQSSIVLSVVKDRTSAIKEDAATLLSFFSSAPKPVLFPTTV